MAHQVYDQVLTENGAEAALRAQVKAVVIHELGHIMHAKLSSKKYWELKGLAHLSLDTSQSNTAKKK